MSKIQNVGLDEYGAEPFEQQQFRTAGIEWVNVTRIVQAAIARLKPHKFDAANKGYSKHFFSILILTFVYTMLCCSLRLTFVGMCQISCYKQHDYPNPKE